MSAEVWREGQRGRAGLHHCRGAVRGAPGDHDARGGVSAAAGGDPAGWAEAAALRRRNQAVRGVSAAVRGAGGTGGTGARRGAPEGGGGGAEQGGDPRDGRAVRLRVLLRHAAPGRSPARRRSRVESHRSHFAVFATPPVPAAHRVDRGRAGAVGAAWRRAGAGHPRGRIVACRATHI